MKTHSIIFLLTKKINIMKTTEMEKLRTETFGNKRVYELQFNHENDGCWYIDFPGWPFSHHNLMMVAGADELCAVMSDDDKVAKVNVIPTKNEEQHEGYAHLKRLSYTITGGAYYKVEDLPGFEREIWLCPVTLFVLGKYPKNIYLKKIA